MADFYMVKGCTYKPKIKISKDDKVLTNEDITKIYFSFYNVIKVFPSEDVQYKDEYFEINLNSNDTLSMPVNREFNMEAVIIFPQNEKKPIRASKTFIVQSTNFSKEVFLDDNE